MYAKVKEFRLSNIEFWPTMIPKARPHST